MNTEKVMALLAKFFEKHEKVVKEMLDVDHEVHEKCEMIDDAATMVIEAARRRRLQRDGGKSRERRRNEAEVCYTKVS